MGQDAFYQALDALYAQGSQQAIEDFLLQAAEQSRVQGDTSAWVAALSELGSFYRGTSRYEQAIAYFVQVRDLIAQCKGHDSPDYAVAVNNLGGAYRMMGDTPKALEVFSQGLQLYRQPAMQQGFYYAALLNNMALAHQQAGMLVEAGENMLEALGVLQKIPESRIETATTLANLAALYQKQGKIAPARQLAQDALRIYDQPENRENPHHAAALNLAAGLCYLEKDYPQAAGLYQQAMQMTEKTFGKNADYARASQSLGMVYRAANCPKEAGESWQKALAVYTKLQLKEPALRVQQLLKQLEEAAI